MEPTNLNEIKIEAKRLASVVINLIETNRIRLVSDKANESRSYPHDLTLLKNLLRGMDK